MEAETYFEVSHCCKPVRTAALSAVVCLLLLTWSSAAVAQEVKTNAAPVVDKPTLSSSSSNSQRVAEIVNMAGRGRFRESHCRLIQNPDATWQLTHDDIITLKKHNVPDEILVLMLKRTSQSRAAVAQAKEEALARTLASRTSSAGGLDPESYDYFRYHYLQPRPLESVYQRLSPYYYYYPPFPYAYGAPLRPR